MPELTNKVLDLTCSLCGGAATDLRPCEGCGEHGHLRIKANQATLLTAMRQAVQEAGGESAPAMLIAEAAGNDLHEVNDALRDLSEAQFVVYDDETDGWWITPPGLAASGGEL